MQDALIAAGRDGDKLTQTGEAYNSGIAAGEPDPFKRGYTAELKDGPYYIMQTVARFATSLGGVNVSNDFEVLDVNEQPVPGLYAAGDCTGGLLQVAKAVYEGALAGTEAAKALRKG